MSTFKIQCPHCEITVEVPQELQDQTVACPACEQEFVAAHPALPKLKFNKKTNETDSNTAPEGTAEKKSIYPWGRFYITIARLFAGLILLGAIVCIGKSFHEAFSLRNNLLKELQKKAEKVAEKQNTFIKHFEPLAEIVLSGNHSQAKFNFPSNLGVIENSFNETLMTEADLQESIDTANEYEAKLQKMTEVMHSYFQKNALKAHSKLNHNSKLDVTTITGQNKNTSLTLNLSKNVDFYSLDPNDLQSIINETLSDMETLSNMALGNSKSINTRTEKHSAEKLRPALSNSKSINIENEMQALRFGLEFIAQTLCNKGRIMHISGQKTSQTVSKQSVGKDEFAQAKELLEHIRTRLEFLYTYSKKTNGTYVWLLTEELSNLRDTLQEHGEAVEKCQKEIKNAFIEASEKSIILLIAGLILAFLAMVFADFLQAHLDTSDTLHKIYTRGMPLMILLLMLAGCAPSPEETLNVQKNELLQAAINNIFANAIDNPDATIYCNPGQEIVAIIAGDIMNSEPEEEMFVPVSVSRTYNIARVKFTVNSVNFNPVRKYNHAPYSHKSVISISVRQAVIMREAAPGLTIHALTPTNFTDMDSEARSKWLRHIKNKLPSDECDHAIAIHSTPFEDNGEMVTRNVEIFFNKNTGFWELKNSKTLPDKAIPIYDPGAAQKTWQKDGFQKFTIATKTGEKREFILNKNDFEIAQKLQAGLIFIDGQWINKETYFLACHMNILKKNQNISLFEMMNFAQIIHDRPNAQNREDAIELLKKYLQNFIQLNANKKKVQESLVEELKEPHYSVLGENTVAEMTAQCKENITRLNATEQARLATDIATKKASLTGILGKLKEIKELLPEKITTAYNIAKESGLFEADDLKKQFNVLLHLYGVNRQQHRAMQELLRNNWVIGDYNLRLNCRSCRGKGKASCSTCKNSGICQTCRGTGSREHRVPSQHSFDFHTTRVSCPSECTYCEGQRKICVRCQGTGGYINRKMLQEAIPAEASKTIELLDSYITKGEKELENLKK